MPRAVESLARLNPTTCRFDIGNGGIPDLTTIDIAAALAMTGDQIGSHLLQLSVLGYGIPGALPAVLTLTRALVEREIESRQEAETVAEMQGLLGISDSVEIRSLRSMARDRWPQDRARMDRITVMVVHELIEPEQCWTCGGNGPHTRMGRQLMSLRKMRAGMSVAEIVEAAMPRRDMTEKSRARWVKELAEAVTRNLGAWQAAGIVTSFKAKVEGRDVEFWKSSCKHCHGTGKRPMTEQKLADFVGLSMSGWRSAQTSHAFLRWLRSTLNDRLQSARHAWGAALDTTE